MVIGKNLRDFVQFKKREKHLLRSFTFNPATLQKVTLLHG